MSVVNWLTDNNHRDRAVCLALLVAAAAVFSRDIHVGGPRYSDACTHAMDGVLIHDWILSGPRAWIDPMGFATRQYAHYPTLGIGRVYPPGFAIVESLFFAVFGISAVSARLCTLAFGLAAVGGCYKLARRFTAPLAAACATGFLISMPGVVYWTRQAMLEMPTLAVLIWATYATMWYFDRPTWRRLAVAVVLALSAPLFKQTAVFIIPVVGAFFVARAWRRQIPVRHLLVSGTLVILPLAAFFVYTLLPGGSAAHMVRAVSMDKPIGEWLSAEALAFYPRTVAGQVGVVVLGLSGVGLLLSLVRMRWPWTMILLWFGLFTCMALACQHKEARYFFFGYLPIALWAGLAAGKGIGLIPTPRLRTVLGVLVVAAAAVMGYRAPTRIEPDYTPLIADYEPHLRGKIVLFEGHRDGDFVFAARRHLGVQGCVVIRGSKVFYSCAADPQFDFASYVSSKADIAEIIDSFGFQTLFVERRNLNSLAEVDLLHDELDDDGRYELVESYRLSADRRGGSPRTRVVDVYRPRHPPVRRKRFVDIPVPIASRIIRIDLDALTSPGA